MQGLWRFVYSSANVEWTGLMQTGRRKVENKIQIIQTNTNADQSYLGIKQYYRRRYHSSNCLGHRLCFQGNYSHRPSNGLLAKITRKTFMI